MLPSTVDRIPPTIASCPTSGVAVTVELGETSGPAFWQAITATDLSNVVDLVSQTNAPGDSFMLGTTTVMYIFADASGNRATCSFTVTVTPDIRVCHGFGIFSGYTSTHDIWLSGVIREIVELGSQGTIVLFPPPTATDFSGVATVTPSHRPGAFFQVGTTSVTYRFEDATGNFDECTFVSSGDW
ncbi:putative hyalin [Apostichopus japonicus]|uniref:Putative hyalin n=1 Tax=Stichopus japonicus TaxID=307972 RepID=A0A2G8JRJ4_STIJA|nr:putative hyalin [Apostichopus japonicus]